MMTGEFITLHGYCAPFNQVGWHEGAAEFIDKGAFDSQIARGIGDVFLNFGSHDAEPLARPLTLFGDHYGVGFSVAVSWDKWRSINSAIYSTHQHCSVNFKAIERKPDKLADGSPAWRVVRGSIEHVCIVDCRAVYADTGIWPAHEVGNESMPPRLRKLAATWLIGWNRHVAQQKRAQTVAAGRRNSSGFSEMMDARFLRYAQFRREIAAKIAAGEVAPVLCHTAFTRGGGYKPREFEALIANARAGWRSAGK